MAEFPEVLPHGPIEELFDGIFFVTGQMCTQFPEFPGVDWSYNRNMTVVRQGDELTIVNSVRLTDDGLAQLDALGRVTNLVRIGALHDRDDAFYVDRYHPRYWTMPGIEPEGITVDARLTPGGDTPFTGCTVFAFETTNLPEGILVVDRDGGVAISCDALQNWIEPDEYFDDGTTTLMGELGFWTPANFGPLFMIRSQPQEQDYRRLLQIPFRHALCGHGDPLRDTAHEDYTATADRVYAT